MFAATNHNQMDFNFDAIIYYDTFYKQYYMRYETKQGSDFKNRLSLRYKGVLTSMPLYIPNESIELIIAEGAKEGLIIRKTN